MDMQSVYRMKSYSAMMEDCGTFHIMEFYHPQKKKIRVVFDCAASYRGVSLNQELLQGPDLTSSLFGVMQRFRQERIALMADIKGMFNQVRVPKEDRDLLRFLWWEDGDISKPVQVY